MTCAILSADIVGYSKLCEIDDAWTHQELVKRFNKFQDIVSMNHGVISRLRGDSILVLFENPKDAFYCAIEMQEATSLDNISFDKSQRILFRIGIHFGEVLFDGGEPYGKTVNHTVRLQENAMPGSIYISDLAKSLSESYYPFSFEEVIKPNFLVNDISKIYLLVYRSAYETSQMPHDLNHKYWLHLSLPVNKLVGIVAILSVCAFIFLWIPRDVNTYQNDLAEVVINKPVKPDDDEVIKLPLPVTKSKASDEDAIDEHFRSIDVLNPMIGQSNVSQHSVLFYDQIPNKISVLEADNKSVMKRLDLIVAQHKTLLLASEELYKNTYKELEHTKKINQQLSEQNKLLINQMELPVEIHAQSHLEQVQSTDPIKENDMPMYSLSSNTAIVDDIAREDIYFYIELNIERAPHVIGRDIDNVKNWLNEELITYLTKYAEKSDLNPVFYYNASNNSIDYEVCAIDKYKKIFLINLNLTKNSYWWNGLEFDITNCNNRKHAIFVIPGLTPRPSYGSINNPWLSDDLRKYMYQGLTNVISSLNHIKDDA